MGLHMAQCFSTSQVGGPFKNISMAPGGGGVERDDSNQLLLPHLPLLGCQLPAP